MAFDYLSKKMGLEKLHHWILTDELPGRSFPIDFLHQACRIIYAIGQDLKNGQLSLRAMSLVYTTIIAIVPLLALSFSVLKGFDMHENLKPVLLEAMLDLGDKRFEIVDNIMTFINNVNVGVLGAVGFAVLIYSVIAMMHKIENAFNYTWQVARARSVSQRVRDYLSVVFIAPLLLMISAILTGSSRFDGVVALIEALPFGGLIMAMAAFVLPYILMSLGFAFIYMFIPNTQVKASSALLGGFVTTIIWKLMGWGVANFVAGSASNTAIYSAFASVIILMVWLYACWFALLIGASVAFYHQNYKAQTMGRIDVKLSLADEELLALEIMKNIGGQYQHCQPLPTMSELAHQLGVSEIIVNRTVNLLVENGFLLYADEPSAKLFPQKPLDKIMLVDIIETVRYKAESTATVVTLNASTSVNELSVQLKQQQQSLLQNKTLQSLISSA